MSTVTIIPPSRWQPYTVVDTHAVGLEIHRAIQAALRARGVASETSGESLRWAIGTANGHSFGVYGDVATIAGMLREVGRDLGFGVAETATTHGDTGCPACGLSGLTPEQAARVAPRYMAALRALPEAPIPDAPAAWCWDCRRLHAAGRDPQALALADAAEQAPSHDGGDGRPRVATVVGEPAIDLATRLGVDLHSMHDRLEPHLTAEQARQLTRSDEDRDLALAMMVHVVTDEAAHAYADRRAASVALRSIAAMLTDPGVRDALKAVVHAALEEPFADALAGSAAGFAARIAQRLALGPDRAVMPDGSRGPRWQDAITIAQRHGCVLADPVLAYGERHAVLWDRLYYAQPFGAESTEVALEEMRRAGIDTAGIVPRASAGAA